MTDRLPRVSAAEAARALEKAGFSLVRQSGSHRIYKNADGYRVTVPNHSGKELHPKIIKSILRDADLTAEEFIDLIR
jgi:predicted RNA binding protein YcfA (HicA-like mRNA interferase family)